MPRPTVTVPGGSASGPVEFILAIASMAVGVIFAWFASMTTDPLQRQLFDELAVVFVVLAVIAFAFTLWKRL